MFSWRESSAVIAAAFCGSSLQHRPNPGPRCRPARLCGTQNASAPRTHEWKVTVWGCELEEVLR